MAQTQRFKRMGAGLDAIAAEVGPGMVREVRGRGLLRGLALTGPPGPIVEACRERGVLVISAGEDVLRIAPPLVISAEEIDYGLAVLRDVLDDAASAD